MMRVILVGPPGAGKGTQAAKLSDRLEVPHLSAGKLLREAVSEGTEAGERARPYLDEGKLVPVDVVVDIMIREMFDRNEKDGFVVDGFPRNMEQYRELHRALEQRGESLDVVVQLNLPEQEVMKRLSGRRICEECGRNYHVDFKPPREDNICDTCGADLYQRDDDNPETIRHRLKVYREESLPVSEKYRDEGKLEQVNAEGEVDEVFQRILSIIRSTGDESSIST